MSAKGMIFLDNGHPILEEAVRKRLTSDKHASVDISVSDFDNVRYRICTDVKSPNLMKVMVRMACLGELKKNGGADEVIDRIYGSMVSSSSGDDFDLVLEIDLDNVQGDPDVLVKNISELKRNLMGAPMEKYFKALVDGSSLSDPFEVEYRPGEMMYFVPASDRVIVVYGVDFRDLTDRAVAHVFLQEFAEAQRHVAGAPPVSFSKEAPREIRGMNARDDGSLVGFVSFAIFKEHVNSESKMRNVINLLHSYRTYLDFHIKASKSYLHTRMRRRVDNLLKVLNRAHPQAEEGEKVKKTMAGKTFTRK